MSDIFVTCLETASDPWALAFISFLIAGVIVVCGAIAFESNPPAMRKQHNDESFFDRITEYHHEL